MATQYSSFKRCLTSPLEAFMSFIVQQYLRNDYKRSKYR